MVYRKYKDHGRSDVTAFQNTFTNSCYHFNPADNPGRHEKGVPGLHPQTPIKENYDIG